jgi:hypothetical protein
MTRLTYDFTDHEGTVHEVDSSPEVGVNLGFKPHENFLINFDVSNLQIMSLDDDTIDGGMLVRLYLDYLM